MHHAFAHAGTCRHARSYAHTHVRAHTHHATLLTPCVQPLAHMNAHPWRAQWAVQFSWPLRPHRFVQQRPSFYGAASCWYVLHWGFRRQELEAEHVECPKAWLADKAGMIILNAPEQAGCTLIGLGNPQIYSQPTLHGFPGPVVGQLPGYWHVDGATCGPGFGHITRHIAACGSVWADRSRPGPWFDPRLPGFTGDTGSVCCRPY